MITGIAASTGISIAKAYLFEQPNLNVEKKLIENVELEIDRLEKALDQAKQELIQIKDHALKELGQDKADIFAAHLLVLSDPELINPIKEKIQMEKVNAEFSLKEVSALFIVMFEQMDNEYMKERAADIRDVTNRVQAHLLGVTIPNLNLINEEVIIIAEDLTPSDTAQLNRQFVKGFTTNIGGRTSHSAIMARSLEIPAVVGTKNVTKLVKPGDLVIVDGLDGKVIINPSTEEIDHYNEKKVSLEKEKQEWAKLKNSATVSLDGEHVELAANIGTPNDVQGVLNNGGEGVGLYRTEFLYMGREQLPTEEEQFVAYKTVLENMQGKPVVVRTLDIGGDKELPYLHFPKEMNPFLGYRAIRLCLDQQEIFRTQLRALLRASTYGHLKIMFPMIATLEEFLEAKSILLEEKELLVSQGEEVSSTIEVGMMVEIPATAIMADQFAKEVDFFSIGTNDLIQYTMAVDRMNEQVAYLYQPYHPAILRLVKMVVDAAHKEGKWVGMCGEMAGDQTAIPILLAMGLDEFSMSASSILPARSLISKLNKKELEDLIPTLLSFKSGAEVESYIKSIVLNNDGKL
ncbi:phosphoenolpyruvate--protein phosphotransferase [Anaerobacillus isosaccharinicus]|uniref:Phosphoenolpyruvate-protein phosphotransferase n=1 Tax=Anaerobacillus isosaccharinicus TaxID=1532552 RepID=A0A7S7RC01_9BACI|nr:phosphoenolpyruvate--protein phosphotransferase [Anaerobacillus isosaccharinicus]MBA5585223.1 phosphoenolpyruvate--protein phosphotransferase [Anaerobacillus isosaccharinicus]QOY36442.1 phosphoenolpyruvate--protein phosphotransferase [Anaerobacillus isosaccharinicus]